MMVYLLNQDMDNSVRITWLVVTALMPVLGVPLFWYTKSDVGHNALKRRLLDLEGRTRAQLPQNEQTVELLQEQAPEAVPLARYLRGKGGGFPVYADTVATYFNGGEAMFDEMLRQLETAKKYIFLEYFIVDEGLMWGRILEVLARKAAQGVDVRVMYDGTCEFPPCRGITPAGWKRWASSARCSRRSRPLFPPTTTTATTAKFWSLMARWALPAA